MGGRCHDERPPNLFFLLVMLLHLLQLVTMVNVKQSSTCKMLEKGKQAELRLVLVLTIMFALVSTSFLIIPTIVNTTLSNISPAGNVFSPSQVSFIQSNTIHSVSILNGQARTNDSDLQENYESFINASLVQSILSFLERTQDDGSFRIKSMDEAYYRGLSLSHLVQLGVTLEKEVQETFVNAVVSFVMESRNVDGGFGNWKGAPSSMESTFQAIQILVALDKLDQLELSEINSTLNFVKSLETEDAGFYPLPNWDEPDVTSTFRATWIFRTINATHPQLSIQARVNSTKMEAFIHQLYLQASPVAGELGFSEVIGGKPDLLSTYYAMSTLQLLGLDDVAMMYANNVTTFLMQLTNPNGGITNKPYNHPTTGYTSIGIRLYLLLADLINVTDILPPNYLEQAINYLKANKKSGSGFTASDRDNTPEFSATFSALRAFAALKEKGELDQVTLDLTGVFAFINEGKIPTFGFGNYPGDATTVERTAQAILTGALLGNLSWVHPKVVDFLLESFDKTKGGFGIRPKAKALIKYTYNAIRALRALGVSLSFAPDIVNFLAASQNDDGGFGQDPRAKLSYLTHTYWAMRSLKLLENDITSVQSINVTSLVEWLRLLRYVDGTYGNYFGWERTLASTYRGVMVSLVLGTFNASENPLQQTLLLYFQDASTGGFKSRFTSTSPSMEATLYGVTLAYLLNISLNITKLRQFVLSLHNNDGGFAPRPQFSSRVSATYHAILILKLLKEMETRSPGSENQFVNGLSIDEVMTDMYGPIIEPAYIPMLDVNKSFSGTYPLIARIVDVESSLTAAWVEALWILENESRIRSFTFTGSISDQDPTLWTFILGPFSEDGYLLVRIHGLDESGNLALSEWLSFKTVSAVQNVIGKYFDIIGLIIAALIPFTFVIGISDDLFSYRRKKKMKLGDVKMEIPMGKKQTREVMASLVNNLNIFYLVLLMALVSVVARLFLGQALPILDQSTFLFRFLLGALIILTARYIMGVRTFGFFAPMVLVISWMQIGPLWAVSVFLFIFLVAHQARRLIEPLNLGYGFRIAILMVICITTLAVLEILGETFRIMALSTSILLPIIITPNMVDRYVREALETNESESFLTLMKTLFVAAAAYLVMSFDPFVKFIVLNPEIWIVIMLIMVYLGKTQKHTRVDKKRFSRLIKKKEDPLTLLIRNRDYIARYNRAALFPLINKFNMKEQFEKWRVPTAELHAIVADQQDVPLLMKRLQEEDIFRDGFVIKPAQSFGGRGIVVVEKRTSDGYFIIEGERYHPHAIELHLHRILQGEFMTSMTRSDHDIVIIEEKITVHPSLAKISLGLPDIRVIVFRGIPVMAMARLPTNESHGKANLKQGAIGAAISISQGIIFRAEKKGIPLKVHPDTKQQIVGYSFERWHEVLAIASLAQKSSGLGYVGVDIVVDEKDRILVLEVNKRPGLEIQNVNNSSLLFRLKYIEDQNLDATKLSPARAARMGIELAQNIWENDFKGILTSHGDLEW